MLAFLFGNPQLDFTGSNHRDRSGKLRAYSNHRIIRLILLTDQTIPPAQLIQQRITASKQAAALQDSEFDCFALEFVHQQYYLPEQSSIRLIALIYIQLSPSSSLSIEGSIFPSSGVLLEELQGLDSNYASLKDYCKKKGFFWVNFTAPWLLAPIQIPKPWGQELWFTGIEARGQSVVCGEGGNLPLPWMLSLFPQTKNPDDEVILLKVLDPLPDEVYGDLYLELHEQKQEVYVVTHIDPQAWPDGIASMQMGFNQQLRQSYFDDETFKKSYLDAVRCYEKVRRALDRVLAQKKREATIPLDQPVAAETLKKWMKELAQLSENKEVIEQEKSLRSAMNAFIGSHPLRVGDWVKVPRYMPHSLQHGIRVIEFQTPVYERKILSFAQQVLTQNHWDTEEAMQLAELGPYQPDQPAVLQSSETGHIERIACFDDFEVRRIRFNGAVNLDSDSYSLLMTLQGEVSIASGRVSMELASGQAVLLPGTGEPWSIASRAPVILLHSLPSVKGAK